MYVPSQIILIILYGQTYGVKMHCAVNILNYKVLSCCFGLKTFLKDLLRKTGFYRLEKIFVEKVMEEANFTFFSQVL